MQDLEFNLSSAITNAADSFLKTDEIETFSELITTIEKIYVSRSLQIQPDEHDLENAEKLVNIAVPLESQMHFLKEIKNEDLLRGYALIALIFEYAAKVNANTSKSWLFWLRSSLAYLKASQSANSIVCAKRALNDVKKFEIKLDDTAYLAIKFLIRNIPDMRDSSNQLLEKLKSELDKESPTLEDQSKIFAEIEFCLALIKVSDFLINGTGNSEKIIHHLDLSLSHFKKSGEDNSVWLISRLSIAINELMKNSLWNLRHILHEEIIKAFTQHREPIYDLWDNQLKALHNLIDKGSKKHHTLVMPTSAGKTLVAALTISKELFGNHNICFYVTPYKALVSEVAEFLTKYLEQLGIKTSYLPGKFDSIPYLEDMLGAEGRIFVLTPEKLDLLWRIGDKRLKECGVFIFDEVQNIAEEGRGLRLELLISRIKQNFGIYSRMILLSAVIPEDNLANFTEWIGSKTSTTSKIDLKPTRSLGAYYYRAKEVDFGGDIFYWNRFNIRKILEPDPQFTPRNDAAELAFKYSAYLGPVLVYCNTRDAAEKTAELIYQKISFFQKENDLEEEAQFAESVLGPNSLLPKMLRCRIAFHHASIPDSIKYIIERLGRDGKLNIICSTSTLVEGVNLSVGTVIITSPYSGSVLMNGLKLKNLAGRAGRALKDTEGHVITMHSSVKAALTEDQFVKFQSRFFRYLSSLDSPTLDADVDALESDLLSRLYRKEITADHIDQDTENIMKTTLFSRQANNLQYSAIIDGVKKSANKIFSIPNLEGIPLRVFAETGLGIRNCQLLDEQATKLAQNKLPSFRIDGNLNLDYIMNVIVSSILPSSRFGSRLKHVIRTPLNIIELWFRGKTLLDIAASVEDNPSPKTVRSITQFLYGYVSDELSWTATSLLKLIDSKKPENTEMSLDYEWYLLPSYLKYGVNNPAALLLILSGVNDRDYANKISKEFTFTKIDWIRIICWILELKSNKIIHAQNNLLSSLGSFSLPINNDGAKTGLCLVENSGKIFQNDMIVGNVDSEFLSIIKILSFKKCSTFILIDGNRTLLQINPS